MTDPSAPERDGEELGLYDDDPGLDIEALRHRRELVLTFLAMALILAVTVFAALKFFRPIPVNPSQLASVTQLAIRQAFPGRSLQIGGADEMRIKQVTEGKYEISGRLYDVTPQGHLTYYVFTCWVENVHNAGWRPAKLTVTPLF